MGKKNVENVVCWPPVPTAAIFFNVVASILLKYSFICFWDAAHHNNDDKIKILNALILESQDLMHIQCHVHEVSLLYQLFEVCKSHRNLNCFEQLARDADLLSEAKTAIDQNTQLRKYAFSLSFH